MYNVNTGYDYSIGEYPLYAAFHLHNRGPSKKTIITKIQSGALNLSAIAAIPVWDIWLLTASAVNIVVTPIFALIKCSLNLFSKSSQNSAKDLLFKRCVLLPTQALLTLATHVIFLPYLFIKPVAILYPTTKILVSTISRWVLFKNNPETSIFLDETTRGKKLTVDPLLNMKHTNALESEYDSLFDFFDINLPIYGKLIRKIAKKIIMARHNLSEAQWETYQPGTIAREYGGNVQKFLA